MYRRQMDKDSTYLLITVIFSTTRRAQQAGC
uniref:Uncharacterized protein n=1 Tax=Arundo donax TaxID=35708 RepID=A0A0A9C4U8_ARUDO